MEIRQLALDALRQPEWTEKAHILGLMAADRALDVMTRLEVPVDIPGRPAAVRVVSPSALRTRSVHTTEGRAGLIHALAHIEFNAINLALDIVWISRQVVWDSRQSNSTHEHHIQTPHWS